MRRERDSTTQLPKWVRSGHSLTFMRCPLTPKAGIAETSRSGSYRGGCFFSGGVVVRLIEEPNGAGRFEIWEAGKGWVDGTGKVTRLTS